MILFDTDICIGIMRGNNAVLSRRKLYDDDIAVSFMTVAELFYGAEKSSNPDKNFRLIEQFLLSVKIINTDMQILMQFGKMKSELERQGNPLADADLLIAATCKAHCNLLVSGNTRHYERISGIKLDNWLR